MPFPPNYFDVVLFCEILEHLITSHPPYSLFKEMNRVLKNTGYLVLSTPNIAELANRVNLLIGKNPVSRPQDESEFYAGHYREYTFKELLYLLNETGFEVKKVRMKNYVGPCLKQKRILPKIYCIFLKISPSSFRTTIQISAKKKM